MKLSKRPFVVEVKRRRSITKPSASILAGIDLVGAAETLEAAGEETKPPEHLLTERVNELAEVSLEPRAERDPLTDDASPLVEEEFASATSATQRAKVKQPVRVRRLKQTVLSRADRWKRRLPRLLRTRRGS